MKMSYEEFIESKVRKHENTGFITDKKDYNTCLFDYQKDIIHIALKKGNYAGRHEFLGVLIEEIEELKQEIFKKEPDFDRLGAEIVDCLTVLIKGYGDIVESKNVR